MSTLSSHNAMTNQVDHIMNNKWASSLPKMFSMAATDRVHLNLDNQSNKDLSVTIQKLDVMHGGAP